MVRVVDGDTICLVLDLGWRIALTANCRIEGIDAPELNTPEGKAARVYAQGLLTPDMHVEFDSVRLDKYGRPLGHLTFRGLDFGTVMVAAGHAKSLIY